jgi:hypothetical protein
VAHHQPGDQTHKAALLGNLDEHIGPHRIAFLIGPARQRLGPHNPSVGQIDDGLIDDAQLVFANRPAELLLHAAAAPVEERKHEPDHSAGQPAQRNVNTELGVIGRQGFWNRDIGRDAIGEHPRASGGVEAVSRTG